MTLLTCTLGPDAAGTMLMRLLRDARWSVDAAIYEVGPSYRWALVKAAERGVRVRLLVDAHASDGNAATAAALNSAGGCCRVAGVGADAAHAKLLLVDATVAVGSGNLIWRDAPHDHRLRLPPAATPLAGTREWWALASRSRRLHRAAAEAFAAQWDAAAEPPPGWFERASVDAPAVGIPLPQVAPHVTRVRARRLRLVTGGASVARELQSMVDAAGVQILATVPYARPGAPPVADLLAAMSAASSRRVECGLLLGGVPDPADAARLVQLPFAVRRMDSDRSTSGHAKGLVADRAVLVSSANWSSTGLGGNWEAALRIDDPAAAAYYAAAWRRDWDSARPIEV